MIYYILCFNRSPLLSAEVLTGLEVFLLMEQAEYNRIRYSIQQQCGNKVKIQLDRGRNKVDVQEGVIQQAYPSVFTVLVSDDDAEHPDQLLSFSYTDVITKEIRMELV